MCGRPVPAGLECLADAETAGSGMGWALAIPIMDPAGLVPVYYPSRYPPGIPTRGTHPACTTAPHGWTTSRVPSRHAHMTVLRDPEEILGVEYAQVYWDTRGHAEAAVPSRSRLTPQLSGPLPGACSNAQPHILSISQYFSVFHGSEPEFIIFLSISQYFSVFTRTAMRPAPRPSCRINEERLSSAQARGY